MIMSTECQSGGALHRNQHGAVAVSVALLLVVLLAVMALAMDTSYLYLKKSAYQNGVEAAALAGVRQLCDGDWEEVTRQVAEANGVPSDSISLTVETGFYDELNEFSGNLGEYKDFGPPPSGRYINAVHVRLSHNLPSLTGMNATATVAAEAVAYLKRIDIASLDPDGSIHLGHNSVWEDTVFFANGDILWPQEATATISGATKTYQPPEFDESLVLAAGEVASCPVKVTPYGSLGEQMAILRDAKLPQPRDYVQVEISPITEVRPVDDEILDYWRQRADVIYTPDQAGQDNVYVAQSHTDGTVYLIDAASNNSNQRVIFFDAGDNPQGIVRLGPISPNEAIHASNGNTMSGLTFVATCPIRIQNSMPKQQHFNFYVGGENEDQSIIISAKDIEIFTDQTYYEGVVFRTGKDFIQLGSGYATTSTRKDRIRIIADGNVHAAGENHKLGNSIYSDDPGIHQFNNNSQFGPPCPPGMARLGLLEPSE